MTTSRLLGALTSLVTAEIHRDDVTAAEVRALQRVEAHMRDLVRGDGIVTAEVEDQTTPLPVEPMALVVGARLR